MAPGSGATSGERRPLRSEPAAWFCLALAGVLFLSIAVGIGAHVTLLGRWMGGMCGDWAPPGWKSDPRCDGSLYKVEDRAFAIAWFAGGGLCLACAWLVVCRRRAQ